MRAFLSIFLILFLSFSALGQRDIVHFENVGRENGLAQSTITGIVQGSQDFMWFGTAEGLHRYDGYDFQIYKNDLRDSNSLANNHITALFEDEVGTLWIGTYTGVLDRFDKKSEHFEHIYITNSDGSRNPYQINDIVKDQHGNLLVGLDGGGMAMMDKTGEWTTYTTANSALTNNYIQAIVPEASRSGFWVCTQNGLNFYDHNSFIVPTAAKSFTNQSINSVLRLGDKLFVVTNGQGLQIWDDKTSQVTAIPSPRIRGANFTTFIIPDDFGQLWIGTNGAGVHKFDGERFVTYQNNPFNYRSIIGDNVTIGFKDKDGGLWFGCINGISMFNPKSKLFQLFQAFEHDGKPTNNNIYSIYEDRNGFIWLGTLGGGLARFNPLDESIKVYPKIKDGDIETKAVRSIYEDANGTLWIGTRDEGLFSFDRSNDKFRYHPPQNPSYNIKTIRNIFEDKDGQLWLATRWGLAKYDRNSGEYELYQNQYLANNPIYQIIEDEKRDELLLVTFRTGLHIFNKQNQTLTVFQHSAQDSTSPSVNAMMCIEQISPDSFLIGTYAGGLNIFDRKRLRFGTINSQNGLPNDVVYGLLRQDDSLFWLSTNDGLIRYNSKQTSFIKFGLGDYLQGLEFNEGAYWKNSKGYMYFGGLNGFNYFKPEEIAVKPFSSTIALTSFKISNKPIQLTNNINYADRLELGYDEKLVSIGFAALTYLNSSRTTYRYKLEGFDDDWIEAGNRREAFYTHLSPGTYTFRVQSYNALGILNKYTKSLKISIKPPYWQTWWFRILASCVILLSLGYLFWQRQKQLTENYKNKLVDLELKALRSQMNPHFIFNSLNSIQYFVLNNSPKEAYSYLTKFSSLMRMILQNSRARYITLEEEKNWLNTYLDLEKLRLEGELDYQIVVDENLDYKNTYLPSMLIQPYVENALLHGLLPKPANRLVKIEFSKDRDRLKCLIEDNGIGRAASAELNAKRTKKHRSQGIRVTSERLEILTRDYAESPEFNIQDLFDENGYACGTRVTLLLPLNLKPEDTDA